MTTLLYFFFCRTQVFKYENGELTEEAIKEFDKDSTQQINQMSQTISDFTNFFSPEVNAKKFYLKEVIAQTLSFLKPIFIDQHINVHLNMRPETDVLLYGYPNELEQMIINILNNAKDALIEREVENREIWIVVERVKEEMYISIEDSGGGISPEIISKIFDPYFSTKSKNGTGLGLYMSKLIIEDHMSGKLLVSNSDRGARFEIILPIVI